MAKLRRFTTLAALAATLVFSTGLLQGQSSDRVKKLGGGMVCMCGCAEILTECNHVGCKTSAPMLKELSARVASGDSDDLILQSFVQEYGDKVLAEPATHGFNSLAWAIPGIAFAIGLALVVVVIRQWRRPAAVVAATGPPVSSEMLERARREIDRETQD
jgi:cytochrome c-type biogenesis protein CcmH